MSKTKNGSLVSRGDVKIQSVLFCVIFCLFVDCDSALCQEKQCEAFMVYINDPNVVSLRNALGPDMAGCWRSNPDGKFKQELASKLSEKAREAFEGENAVNLIDVAQQLDEFGRHKGGLTDNADDEAWRKIEALICLQVQGALGEIPDMNAVGDNFSDVSNKIFSHGFLVYLKSDVNDSSITSQAGEYWTNHEGELRKMLDQSWELAKDSLDNEDAFSNMYLLWQQSIRMNRAPLLKLFSNHLNECIKVILGTQPSSSEEDVKKLMVDLKSTKKFKNLFKTRQNDSSVKYMPDVLLIVGLANLAVGVFFVIGLFAFSRRISQRLVKISIELEENKISSLETRNALHHRNPSPPKEIQLVASSRASRDFDASDFKSAQNLFGDGLELEKFQGKIFEKFDLSIAKYNNELKEALLAHLRAIDGFCKELLKESRNISEQCLGNKVATEKLEEAWTLAEVSQINPNLSSLRRDLKEQSLIVSNISPSFSVEIDKLKLVLNDMCKYIAIENLKNEFELLTLNSSTVVKRRITDREERVIELCEHLRNQISSLGDLTVSYKKSLEPLKFFEENIRRLIGINNVLKFGSNDLTIDQERNRLLASHHFLFKLRDPAFVSRLADFDVKTWVRKFFIEFADKFFNHFLQAERVNDPIPEELKLLVTRILESGELLWDDINPCVSRFDHRTQVCVGSVTNVQFDHEIVLAVFRHGFKNSDGSTFRQAQVVVNHRTYAEGEGQ